MDTEQLNFLASPAGTEALALAATLPTDRLTRLQRLRHRLTPSLASGVVELLELRNRAQNKFSRADKMFFTSEGLEQSTGERIATYRASKFSSDTDLLDACSGNGGDAQARAKTVPHRRQLLVDSNPVALQCARLNVQVATLASTTLPPAICADITTLNLSRIRTQGFRAVLFDPSRRTDTRQGRRRVTAAEDYSPPLSFVQHLANHFDCVGVKVSPAIDDNALTGVLRGFEERLKLNESDGYCRAEETRRENAQHYVEFIAEGNECKEALIWFERGISVQSAPEPDTQLQSSLENYRATILHKDGSSSTLTRSAVDPVSIPISQPLEWLYEPNPAVIRAHLTAEVADTIKGFYLDPQIAYLTSDRMYQTPFATPFQVLEWMPFNIKQIKSWLRTHQYRVEIVKKRGVPFEPDDVRRQLADKTLSDCDPLVLVLSRHQDRHIALLCKPPWNHLTSPAQINVRRVTPLLEDKI